MKTFLLILSLVRCKSDSISSQSTEASNDMFTRLRGIEDGASEPLLTIRKVLDGSMAVHDLRNSVSVIREDGLSMGSFVRSQERDQIDVKQSTLPQRSTRGPALGKKLLKMVAMDKRPSREARKGEEFARLGRKVKMEDSFSFIVKTKDRAEEMKPVDGDDLKIIWELGPLKKSLRGNTAKYEYIKEKLRVANSILKHYLKVQRGTSDLIELTETRYCNSRVPRGVKYNAHLVIITRIVSINDNTIASAKHCFQDKKTWRTIVGEMDINFLRLDEKLASDFIQMNYMLTFVHEAIHVISFNQNLSDVISRSKNRKTSSFDVIAEHAKKVYLTTQHWSEAYLPNELMNEFNRASRVISIFTLQQIERYSEAYLTDKRYLANNLFLDVIDDYDKFVNYRCKPNVQPEYPYFCSTEMKNRKYSGCSIDYLFKTACDSTERLENDCYSLIPSRTGFCLDDALNSANVVPNSRPKQPFEFFGEGSRCFESNLGVPFCLRFQVEKSEIRFHIDKTVYSCSEGEKEITTHLKTEGDKTMTIKCPDRELFTQALKKTGCPKACSGHGLCSNSKCTCFGGFMGDDCSQYKPSSSEGEETVFAFDASSL